MTELLKYQIKLVPDSAPNDSGEWVDVPLAPPLGPWRKIEEAYAALVPSGFHMIAVQLVTC